MKMIVSLVVVLGMGITTSIYADQQNPDAAAEAAAEAAANCFEVCESDECLRECITRSMTSVVTSRETIEPLARTTECFADCETPACMRSCITKNFTVRGFEGSKKTTGGVISIVEGEALLIGCTPTALENVGICADVFLAPGDADRAGFWACAGGAGRNFLRCAGLAATTLGVSPSQVEFALQLIVEVGVDAVRTGDGVDRTISIRDDSGDGSPIDQLMADAPTFKICATSLQADRDTCETLFAGDDAGKAQCVKGAGKKFNKCLDKVQSF